MRPGPDSDITASVRSWYATAVSAALVAVLMLAVGSHNLPVRLAGLLTIAAAVLALVEGRRRRRGVASRPAVITLAVLVLAAAVLCIGGLVAGLPPG
jgi:hypothetical protein